MEDIVLASWGSKAGGIRRSVVSVFEEDYKGAQLVESLPGMHEILGPLPSTT